MTTKTKTSYKRKRLASAAATLCCACLCRRAAAGYIDTDTPNTARSVDSITNGRRYDLVMSDEFEKEGRNFADGQDPKWTAINKNDYTNAALHYYSKDLVTTSGGKLNITTVNEDVTFRYWEDKKKGWSKMSKTYKSGMLQVSTA
jgi:beta-glucan synthesis-associated protein KRE6